MSEIVVSLKKRHPNQQLIVETCKRFNVLKCGRRFGKSALAEELIIEPALDGFPVAYYAPTYKDLEEFWIVVKDKLRQVISYKSEQTKQLRLITGGIIDMWSLDQPDSGRGRKYKRIVVDECEKSKNLKVAWNGTLRATLTDLKGDCWFLSTPQFGNTYFKELFKRKDDPKFEHEWQGWRFTTYDNPYMDYNEIESAKSTLEPMYFACEYLAEDVTLGSMRWAFAYDPAKHLVPVTISSNLPIILSFDFNRNPISCSVIQTMQPCTIRVKETIKLANSDIYALCDVILAKYGNRLFQVTGDASGNSSNALVQDNLNYYIVIMQKLRLSKHQMNVPTFNPGLLDNRMLVNSLLAQGVVELDPEGTKHLQFDLENVAVSPDGKLEKKNRQDETQQADALDTFRYACNTYLKNFIYLQQS